MADLNDDIKKYLKGELSPAEMHSLEKKALNDPFLEDALAGAGQLDSDAFDSDVKTLRSSLEERISQGSGERVSLWVWPTRIAAGLILVALSTFVIVKLTENKRTNDLALKEEAPVPSKSNAHELAESDSAALSRDVTTEPNTQAAKPEAPTPAEREEFKRQAEVVQSKPGDAGGPAIAATTNNDQVEKEKSNEQLALATERVPEGQPVQDSVATDKDEAAAKKGEEPKLSIDDQPRRVANAAPELQARREAEGLVNVSKVITGRVVSEGGIGLPGVNVMFKNTNIGTVTDASGNYQIKGATNNPSLVFSYIGFTSEEVAAGDKNQVNIEMKEDVSQLSEIVVVGHIADRKTDEEKPETLELANPYGGRRAFKQYLEKNIHYPEQALANNIEGRVTIQFTVESSGVLSDFTVIKGIGHGCDEEVIRLVQQGPKWNPTRRNTESLRDRVKVRMKFTLPKK